MITVGPWRHHLGWLAAAVFLILAGVATAQSSSSNELRELLKSKESLPTRLIVEPGPRTNPPPGPAATGPRGTATNAPGANSAAVGGNQGLTIDVGLPESLAPLVEAIPTSSLASIMIKGGWLMVPIVLSSFILVLFSLERVISLRRGWVIPRHFVKRFMHQMREGQLDRERALDVCLQNHSPVAHVFAHAVRKWGRPAVEVEQAILDGGERTVNQLRRHLRIINGVATVCPLLGLLGTVTGMISAFNAIAGSQAMGRPELLAGGISEALLTTAAGLCVAIPALILHMYFVSRVDQLVTEIDALGQEVVHLISAETLAQSKGKHEPGKRHAA